MATRKATEVMEEPTDELGPEGVRPLEPEPEEFAFEGVEEVAPPPAPGGVMTTTGNFYGETGGGVNEVIELDPEIVEGDEPTYRIRLTTDIESIFIGIDYLLPPMRKDVLYEVNQRVYDYLLPKGLIQGK